MNSEIIQTLFDRNLGCSELAFEGKCHDCECNVVVVIERSGIDGGVFEVSGGALYNPNGTIDPEEMFLKCDKCFFNNRTLENYQENEVYSRIVGYLRPIKHWNDAKQNEYKERTRFNLNSIPIDILEKTSSKTV